MFVPYINLGKIQLLFQSTQIVLINSKNEPYQVVCRESDGYIDVTNLCKAGGKKFNGWFRLEKTKRFLEVLETKINSEYQDNTVTGIHANVDSEYQDTMINEVKIHVSLIKYETGYGSEQGTWVHPKVAINIAHWICPEFDVQVSDWVHKLLVFGTVSLTDNVKDKDVLEVQVSKQKHNRLLSEGHEEEAEKVSEEITKKMRELEESNKILSEKYNKLSRYLEKKNRVQYDSKKVIYIIKHDEFENCYKVGIANNLTSRMSVYNTGAPKDYEVIYYRYIFYNSIVETMIQKKFINNLYTHNKEWYEFEDGPDILIENIDRGVDFFKD